MPRLRRGWIQERNGKIFARISWTDKSGKRQEKSKKHLTRTDANQWIKAELRALDDGGDRAMDGARLTFIQLAEYYEARYVTEPHYVDGRKVAGLRTAKDYKTWLKVLKDYFAHTRVREITHGDLERFRRHRLKTPVILGKDTRNKKASGKEVEKQRTIASVNREMALLRRVLKVAQAQGWIRTNPFHQGDSLISPADERKRERILSRDEESRLLAVCTGPREHLRAIIICALDTGMRAGEIFSLTWRDVDLAGRRIQIQAMNTKTLRSREVPISSRLVLELSRLFEHRIDESVFGIETTVKKGWKSACKAAGISDLRFHDLRHTAATRLVQGGLPLMEVARILGHSTLTTTYRYVNADAATTARAADILDRLNAERSHNQPVN